MVGSGGSVGRREVGEGIAVGSDEGIAVPCGVAGMTLSAGDAVAAADGGGDGGGAGGVANGDTRDVPAGLDRGTTVACGADDVAGVAVGGRTEGRGDAGTMGATELAGATGLGISERAAGGGATVARAFGRAGTVRPSDGTSRVKASTTPSAAPSVTATRPMSDEYAGASRGTGWIANRCATKLKPRSIAPAAAAMATGRRSSLGRSTTLPPIAPIVAPTTISRIRPSAPKTAGSEYVPYVSRPNPVRPFGRRRS